MEETSNRKISVEELINITVAILSFLGINEVKEDEVDLSLDDAVKTLHEYKIIDINGDEDPNHFAYFIKKLFLDDEGSIDLDLNELSKNIPRNFIIEIFKSLVNQLKTKQFFSFIVSLGEIFTHMYFSNQINEDILDEFEKKGINNYEIILILFSRCKHNKSCEFFYKNYDISFRRSYFHEVKSKFLSSLELYFELSLGLPNANDELKFEEEYNSHNTTIDSENRIEKSKAEDSILRNLKLFWCNSAFVYENIILNDFMNFIYNFLTQKTSYIVIDNNLDSFSKKYINYILYPLQKLFNNYDEQSFKEFKGYLNNFVNLNKSEQIDFIQRALRILGPNDENVGLLSFYCFDKATNESIEKISNSLQDMSEESIKDICNNNGLDEYEELILIDNINKKKENLKLNRIEPLTEINLQIHDDSSSTKTKPKEELYPNEIDQLPKDKIVSIDKKNLQGDDNVLNSIKKIIEANQLLQEQVNDLKMKAEKNKLFEEQITKKNKLFEEQMSDQIEKNKSLKDQMSDQVEKYNLLKEQMSDQAEKNKSLEGQISNQVKKYNLLEEQMAKKNKLLEEQMSDQVEKNKSLEWQISDQVKKYSLLEEQMAKKNKLLEEQMSDQVKKNKLLEEQMSDQVTKNKLLKEQMNAQIEKCKLLEEKTNSLNIKVDKLENLHKGIYFRDISKFYIDTFCRNNNIDEEDTYHRAETLLTMDYKNNFKDYKQIMCEIAHHYKEGNKIAHMEYFIKKLNNKSLNDITEEILKSYGNFMGFGAKQKQLLKNNFNLLRAPFLYYK